MNPVDMLAEAARIYPAWWQAHEARPVTVMELAEPVRAAADPDSRGRQFIAVKLCVLDGVRAAGFVLARRKSVGKWSPARYLLNRVEASGEADQCAASPKVRMAPTTADPARMIHAELEAARRALERAARQMAVLYPEVLRIDAARDAAIAAQERGGA
jgi:hypothetical protein